MSGVPRAKKSGGSGKKGKVFLEDKGSLLGLVSSITDTKDAATRFRVDKGKARAAPPRTEAAAASGTPARPRLEDAEKKQQKSSASKTKEKNRALRDAKAAIVAAEKAKLEAKKRRRKGLTEEPVAAGTKNRKRVGFA